MKKSVVTFVALVAAFAVPLGMVGCADDTGANTNSGIVSEMLDSVAAAVAENIIDSQIAPLDEPLAVGLAVKVDHTDTGLPSVNDLFVQDGLVFAGFDGGLLIYELKSQKYSVTPVDGTLRAFAEHGGERFVGGDHLYRIDTTGLVRLEEEIPGQITALCSYGPSLMIGSTEGLYARNVLGCMAYLEDVAVSALVVDNDGLWIGTAGDGLFRWDGQDYSKRFLARDSSVFDDVTALDFNHNHLYVGTTHGMYIFDGGRWQTVTTEQGLPSDEITAIDASNWVVQVGTGDGLATYFDDAVKVVDKMGGRVVTAVSRTGDRVIAGTAQHGLMLKTGPFVKTLVEPWQEGTGEMAAVVH